MTCPPQHGARPLGGCENRQTPCMAEYVGLERHVALDRPPACGDVVERPPQRGAGPPDGCQGANRVHVWVGACNRGLRTLHHLRAAVCLLVHSNAVPGLQVGARALEGTGVDECTCIDCNAMPDLPVCLKTERDPEAWLWISPGSIAVCAPAPDSFSGLLFDEVLLLTPPLSALLAAPLGPGECRWCLRSGSPWPTQQRRSCRCGLGNGL